VIPSRPYLPLCRFEDHTTALLPQSHYLPYVLLLFESHVFHFCHSRTTYHTSYFRLSHTYFTFATVALPTIRLTFIWVTLISLLPQSHYLPYVLLSFESHLFHFCYLKPCLSVPIFNFNRCTEYTTVADWYPILPSYPTPLHRNIVQETHHYTLTIPYVLWYFQKYVDVN
jgi:hypothetical protein